MLPSFSGMLTANEMGDMIKHFSEVPTSSLQFERAPRMGRLFTEIPRRGRFGRVLPRKGVGKLNNNSREFPDFIAFHIYSAIDPLGVRLFVREASIIGPRYK